MGRWIDCGSHQVQPRPSIIGSRRNCRFLSIQSSELRAVACRRLRPPQSRNLLRPPPRPFSSSGCAKAPRRHPSVLFHRLLCRPLPLPPQPWSTRYRPQATSSGNKPPPSSFAQATDDGLSNNILSLGLLLMRSFFLGVLAAIIYGTKALRTRHTPNSLSKYNISS